MRAEQTLDIQSAKRRRVNAMPEFLGTNVAHEMIGSVAMAIGVTIETGYTQAGPVGSTVFRGVELLLRKLGHQQAQTFQLFGV